MRKKRSKTITERLFQKLFSGIELDSRYGFGVGNMLYFGERCFRVGLKAGREEKHDDKPRSV